KHFLEALSLNPKYIEARIRLGEIAYKQNQDEEALKYLEGAYAMAPDHAEASYDLAKLYVRRKMLEEASRVLDQLVRRYPEEPRYHYLLAQVYHKQGNTQQAQSEGARFDETSQKRKDQSKTPLNNEGPKHEAP